MLTPLYWVLGVLIAIIIVGMATVVRFVLYGIGLIALVILIGGLIATGLKEHFKNKPPQ